MLCRQLLDESADYVDRVSTELTVEDISSITEVYNSSRRKQDKKNLQKQISNEDAKASRLTRTQLTAEAIQELASNTKPTNDATFTFDAVIILWCENVEEMCKVKFWEKLKPKSEYKQTWKIARRALIHINALSLPPPKWKIKQGPFNWGVIEKDGNTTVGGTP